MGKAFVYRRGQIWHVKDTTEHKIERGIQTGSRPYLIISSDDGNENNEFVTCLACTSNQNKSTYPINVLYHSSANNQQSVVLCNQVRNISIEMMRTSGRYLETLDDNTMRAVEKAYMLAMGITPRSQMSISELEKVVEEIAQAKLEEIRNNKVVTEDITIDIAAGLENIFSGILREHRKKEKEISEDPNRTTVGDITPGLLKMHNFQQRQKQDEKPVSDTSTEASDTPTASSSQASGKGKGLSKRKPHGFWTTEKMKEFCRDKQTMKIKDFVEKWELDTADQAINQYYNMKAKLNKMGISI